MNDIQIDDRWGKTFNGNLDGNGYAIIMATDSVAAGAVAMVIGILAAWFGLGLFPVAVICCVTVFVLELLPFLGV